MASKSGLEILPSTELQFIPDRTGGDSEARINLRNSNKNGQAIAFKIRAKDVNLCGARPNVGFIPAGSHVTIVFKTKSGILRDAVEKNDRRLIRVDSAPVPPHVRRLDSNALKAFWSDPAAKFADKIVFR